MSLQTSHLQILSLEELVAMTRLIDIDIFKPMLAVDKVGLDELSYPIILQEKIDGIRCFVSTGGQLLSRTKKPIRNKQANALFGKPEMYGFDGELVVYNKDGVADFNLTQSVITSGTISEEHDIKFFAFDLMAVPTDKPFIDRDIMLSTMINKVLLKYPELGGQLKRVASVMASSPDDVVKMLKSNRESGGEGLIARQPFSVYKWGRATKTEQECVKLKFFEDGEFKIVALHEQYANHNSQYVDGLGNLKRSSHQENKVAKGTLGSIELQYNDELTFRCGTGFTQTQRDTIWDNPDAYIGQWAKIRYMSVGAKNLPRVPSFQGIRNVEDFD